VPGALIVVRVPFFLSTKFYSEPDHRVPFGIRSFDNYEDFSGRNLRFYEKWKLGHRTNYGSPARFVVEEKKFHFSNFAVLRWLNCFINLEPVLFERFFATLAHARGSLVPPARRRSPARDPSRSPIPLSDPEPCAFRFRR
jgi:hypothetical protein